MPEPKGRILIVDDQPEMTRLLADKLGDGGYILELANGLAEGGL